MGKLQEKLGSIALGDSIKSPISQDGRATCRDAPAPENAYWLEFCRRMICVFWRRECSLFLCAIFWWLRLSYLYARMMHSFSEFSLFLPDIPLCAESSMIFDIFGSTYYRFLSFPQVTFLHSSPYFNVINLSSIILLIHIPKKLLTHYFLLGPILLSKFLFLNSSLPAPLSVSIMQSTFTPTINGSPLFLKYHS